MWFVVLVGLGLEQEARTGPGPRPGPQLGPERTQNVPLTG
jgi:hypothetical protein